MPHRLASPLQITPPLEQTLYWAIIGIGALFILIIVLLVVRKLARKSSEGPLMDTDFLEGLQAKGGLTDEEMRSVRDAMLRQAAARQRTTTQQTSLSDLKLMSAAGIKPTPETEKTEKSEPESPTQSPAPSGKPRMTPEQLLQNGLISQEDYDVLKARREQEGR